ncbi:hypothetical protein D3C76_1602770 [compost metagenome]
MHVIQHNDICPGLQGFSHLLQIFSLHFNRHRMWDNGSRTLYRLGDSTCTLDVVILNHNGIVQSKSMIRSATHAHCIFLK